MPHSTHRGVAYGAQREGPYMVKVYREGADLIGQVTSEYDEISQVEISPFLILAKEDLERILKPLVERLNLVRPTTQVGYLEKLRWLGEALQALQVAVLPKTDHAWQDLVLGIHRHVFTRTDRRASLSSRCQSYWSCIRGFLSALIEEGVIPVSVVLPRAREELDSLDISSYYDRLLGKTASVPAAGDSIDKLLVSVSLSRTDAEYLDELRDVLAFRRRLLFDCLVDYWGRLKANYEFGSRLLATVDWPSLKTQLDAESRRKNCLADPFRGLEGLSFYLAVWKYAYGSQVTLNALVPPLGPNRKTYIPRVVSLAPLYAPDSPAKPPPSFAGLSKHSDRQTVLWWLGQIITLDVAMICALLTMLHPSWTPFSLLRAQLTNEDGKLHLNFADTGMTFAIDKARAKSMKTEVLDDLSLDIITTTITMSASTREILAARNDPKASLLFLPFGNSKNRVHVATQDVGPRMLGGCGRPPRLWIGVLYPQLGENGLGAGTIGFSKIRHTEGVLEWFRTGSLTAVRRRLGNTEKVVLSHYLPQPLLHAWNERLVRRFQNLWIAVAAAQEDFLLDVTDFSTLDDLHAFLKDMLQLHAATSSPLAEALHRSFGLLAGEVSAAEPARGALHVSVARGSLAALYTYNATVLNAGLSDSALDEADPVTGLCPRQFITLADLLLHQLPKDKNPAIRKTHEAAVLIASDPAHRAKWGRLFVA